MTLSLTGLKDTCICQPLEALRLTAVWVPRSDIPQRDVHEVLEGGAG
jgi:hypothetical protein